MTYQLTIPKNFWVFDMFDVFDVFDVFDAVFWLFFGW